MTIQPYTDTSWSLVPERTVLVNIDDQNDFLHQDGWYAMSGVNIEHMQRVIEPTKKMVAECRGRGVPIVWTRHGTRGAEDAGPFFDLRPFLKDGGLRIDTWGYEILEELGPEDSDWFVQKYRHSAFFQTNLDIVLKGLGAETVLLAGVLTNQCVGATCQDALYRDFKPIVVEECTGTTLPHLHEAAIEMITVGWGQVNDLEETLTELRTFAAEPVQV